MSKPITTFRNGAIGVSVWERKGKNGPFYEFTISRSYIGKDEKPGYTNSIGMSDIPSLRELLDGAERWMNDRSAVLRVSKEEESQHHNMDGPRSGRTAP
jgi:hypothetical protein